MSGDTKNQHYVPQSYLNRFAENGKLSVYLTDKNIILANQDARNFAASRYYYDTDPEELEELLKETLELHPEYRSLIDWNDPQFVEHAFSRSETYAKLVLDELVSHPEKLRDEKTKSKLVIFMHDLAYRVENYRNTQEYINKTTYDWLSEMNLLEETKDYIEKRYGASQGKKEQLLQVTRLSAVLRTANKLLTEYEWFWGQMINDGELIISDDPLLPLRIDGSEIVFPVSRINAIILRKAGVSAPIMGTDKPEDGVINISVPNAVKYDLLQLCAMKRYVFGSERMLKLIISLWNKNRQVVK